MELTVEQQLTEAQALTNVAAVPTRQATIGNIPFTATRDAPELVAGRDQARSIAARSASVEAVFVEGDDEMTDVSFQNSAAAPSTPLLRTQSPDTLESTQIVNSNVSPATVKPASLSRNPSKNQAAVSTLADEGSPGKRPKRQNSITRQLGR